MLPVPLVVDAARINRQCWDAIVSCQMIGVHKPLSLFGRLSKPRSHADHEVLRHLSAGIRI